MAASVLPIQHWARQQPLNKSAHSVITLLHRLVLLLLLVQLVAVDMHRRRVDAAAA